MQQNHCSSLGSEFGRHLMIICLSFISSLRPTYHKFLMDKNNVLLLPSAWSLITTICKVWTWQFCMNEQMIGERIFVIQELLKRIFGVSILSGENYLILPLLGCWCWPKTTWGGKRWFHLLLPGNTLLLGEVEAGTQTEQEHGGGIWNRSHSGMLLTGCSLQLAQLAFSNYPDPPLSRWAGPTLNNHSSRKCTTALPTGKS